MLQIYHSIRQMHRLLWCTTIFDRDLGLKRYLLKIWQKQSATQDSETENSRWIMLSSFDSVTNLFRPRWKIHRMTDCIRTRGIKKESCGNKTFSSYKNDILSVADDVWRRVKIGLQRLDRPIHKSRCQKSTKSVIVSCFCHKSCWRVYLSAR